MSNWFFLYRMEMKKILYKRAVWVAMAIGLAFIVVCSMVNVTADGSRAYIKEQSKTLSAISGEKMDQQFFDAFHKAVDDEINTNWSTYEKLSEYNPGIAYENAADAAGQKALYDLIYNTVRDKDKVIDVTATEFYDSMRNDVVKDGTDMRCSEEELEYWLKSFDNVNKPITYSYALAYLNILDVLFLIGWILILNIAIALSGSFADEKNYKTDALVLSAKNGRGPVCIVKICAGITVALLQATVLLGAGIGILLFAYGTTGWDAVIQNVIPASPWNITIGTMMLIYFALAALLSIFFATTNMILSHLTHSAVATLAIHAAVIFGGLFNIPNGLGIISKLWQLRPTMALYYGSFCNTFRYGCLNNVQITLIIYAVTSVVLMGLLIVSYRRSQVEAK